MFSAAAAHRSFPIVTSNHQPDPYEPSHRPALGRIERELPNLIRFATRLLNNADAARRITEHALVATFATDDQFADAALVPAKLRVAITHACLKACEADDKAQAAAPTRQATSATGGCDWHAEWETVTPRALWGPIPESCFPQDILALIARLPSLQRAALLLADGEGLAGAELGECLGVEAAGARSILHNARQSLQALILGQEKAAASPPVDSSDSDPVNPNRRVPRRFHSDHPHAG